MKYITDIKHNGKDIDVLHIRIGGHIGTISFQIDGGKRVQDDGSKIEIDGVAYSLRETFKFLYLHRDNYGNICYSITGSGAEMVQIVKPTVMDLQLLNYIKVTKIGNPRRLRCKKVACYDICDIFVAYLAVYPPHRLIGELESGKVVFTLQSDENWLVEVTDMDTYGKLLARYKFWTG